jgi:hypothetical protein
MESLVEQGVVSREAFEQMRTLFDDVAFAFVTPSSFVSGGNGPLVGHDEAQSPPQNDEEAVRGPLTHPVPNETVEQVPFWHFCKK